VSTFPYLHPEYSERLPDWQKWRDASDGEDEIKEGKEKYLPRLYGMSDAEYRPYLDRAEWYNASGKTVDAMVGAHHRQPIAAQLPGLDTLEEKASHNQSLEELGQKATREMWRVGKLGILAEILPGELPQLYLYTAESIVNWHYEDDILRFVILKECYSEPKPGAPYTFEEKEQYRVCELIDGVYVQRVMREVEAAGQKGWAFVEELTVLPQMSNGERLAEIPFIVVEYEDNNGECGGSPIADIVSLNLKHYRVTANKQNYLNICSTPILHIDGLDPDDRPKTKMALGVGLTIFTMGGGKSSYTEPSGSALTALGADLAAKEDQMARMGATFLRAAKKAVETADALSIAARGETSVLQQITNTLSKGFTIAVRFLARWLGKADAGYSVTFSSEFFDAKIEQWEAEFLLKLFASNQIDLSTLLDALQAGGLLKKEWVQPLLQRAQTAQKALDNGSTQATINSSTGTNPGEPLPAARL